MPCKAAALTAQVCRVADSVALKRPVSLQPFFSSAPFQALFRSHTKYTYDDDVQIDQQLHPERSGCLCLCVRRFCGAYRS
jgi:hypothetical protein